MMVVGFSNPFGFQDFQVFYEMVLCDFDRLRFGYALFDLPGLGIVEQTIVDPIMRLVIDVAKLKG